jgi:hypothetical protein
LCSRLSHVSGFLCSYMRTNCASKNKDLGHVQ